MTATDKNRQALTALFGNAALADKLQALRVGVWSDESACTLSGRLLAEALGDVLGRLWVSIDAAGPLAACILEAAQRAAASGRKPLDVRDHWAPPYHAVVVLGRCPVGEIGPYVRLGADGWMVYTGAVSRFGDSPVPVGPTFAAGLAGAEVFKIAFSPELGNKARSLIDTELNLLNFGRPAETTPPSRIVLPRTHTFGVGAVTHGLLWVVERWPGEISGELALIDPDAYDVSNGQRYAGMHAGFHGSKAKAKEEILRACHPGLQVKGFEIDGDSYFDRYEPEPNVYLAIAGVDSKEMRRHIALKLPKRAINMWTEGSWLGAARFGGGDGWPCLMCPYAEPKEATLDDVTRIHRATNLSPIRVRNLLDGDNRLTAHDAAIVGQHRGLPPARIAGLPIWSAMQEVCASGSMPIHGQSQNADVPFAFSSLLAGVAGFINLAQEVSGVLTSPFDWSHDVFDRLHANAAKDTMPRSDCMLCGPGYPSSF